MGAVERREGGLRGGILGRKTVRMVGCESIDELMGELMGELFSGICGSKGFILYVR